MKCFLENTSYRNFIIGTSDFSGEHIAAMRSNQEGKAQTVKPKVSHKFRASSAYKQDYGSDLHN